MNDVFAALVRPLQHRPGDPTDERPAPKKHPVPPRLMEYATRRPNAHLPAVRNPWGLAPTGFAVLRAVSEGKSTSEIAKEMDISTSTVESHLLNARQRMGGVNRVHAAVLLDRFLRANKGPTP